MKLNTVVTLLTLSLENGQVSDSVQLIQCNLFGIMFLYIQSLSFWYFIGRARELG